jgi:hypothetical protein
MARFLTTLLLLAIAVAMIASAVRPVCVALTPAQVRQMRPRFDDRDDHDLYYLKIYQRRDGAPFECKTWITRAMLF